MKNGRCRMHGGTSFGAPKGNKNALKHGRYTAEAIARRREVAELIRTARALIGSGQQPVVKQKRITTKDDTVVPMRGRR
jgi:hypothetical protein